MSGDLIDTTEMYLRTIAELLEEGVSPLRARIAERLEQSSPTVSQTVGRMERDGLLTIGDDRAITLSPEGMVAATRVLRRHRLAECMLTDMIGLPLAQVHDEACRWEHVLSDAVELRLVELLGHPTRTAYGTPIPGLADLGIAGEEATLAEAVPLADKLTSSPVTAVVACLSENVQRDAELLATMIAEGILPGATITATRMGDHLELVGDAGRVVVETATAQDLFVEA